MNLAHAMSLVVPPVQDLKRRSQRATSGETTMSPALIALREDRVLCVVTAPRMAAVLDCAATLSIGMAPQMLVVAGQVRLPDREGTDDVPAQTEGEGIAYTSMSREREAGMAVQRYQVGPDGAVRFAAPAKGTPEDRSIMDNLAAAMAQAPLNPAKVARKEPGDDVREQPAVDAARDFLPAPDGRLAIDAGAAATARRKVIGIGGTVLYLAASPAQATQLLGYGLPQETLVS